MKGFIQSLWGCSLCGWLNEDRTSVCGNCKLARG